MAINKVCVIGAGVMGASIAAHVANSRTEVLLLDIASEASDRSFIAASAKEKMLSPKMPQIAHPSLLDFIEIGNLDDDLDKISTCDLIIEVIVEKREIKGNLYKKISPYIKQNTIITSNTSTLPMRDLRSYFPENLQPYFLLTHFFNPPRYLPLLEMIYDQHTSKEAVSVVSEFITNKLGKTIVKSNDTPGFIANRLGCFLMESCLREAYEKKIAINLVDYVFTKYLGFPSTGIFGLFDLIGLDVMQMISNVLKESLPAEDRFNVIYKQYDFYNKMLEDGYKGRKALGGFYRIKDDKKEVLDFHTMDYIESIAVAVPEDMSDEEFFSRFASDIKNILIDFVSYADSLVGVISDSREDIDNAMKLGYGWKYGPFEMTGKLFMKSPLALPYSSSVLKLEYSPILQNRSAFLYEAKPGNLVFSFKTKMNILDEDIFNLLIESVEYAEKNGVEKLIIYTPGKHFSAGANLKLFLELSESVDLDGIDRFLSLGQKAMMAIKYSKVPVIACAKGAALGGGCEILLHSHVVVAHLDLVAGLVEVGVGLIPSWGGLKEMVLRSGGSSEKLLMNLKNIITSNKSSSAYYFAEDYMIKDYHVVMNDNLLLDYALNYSFNFKASAINKVNIPSDIDISGLKEFSKDEHTNFIVKELQDNINSGSLTEEILLEIEKELFKKLLSLSETHNKMKRVVV